MRLASSTACVVTMCDSPQSSRLPICKLRLRGCTRRTDSTVAAIGDYPKGGGGPRIGISAAVAGAAASTVWFVSGLRGVDAVPDELTVVEGAASTTFIVSESVDWTVYVEPAERSLSGLRFELFDAQSSEALTLEPPANDVEYSAHGRSGRPISRARLEPGEYRLERSPTDAILAVGPDVGDRVQRMWLGAALIALPTVIGGGMVATVNLMRALRSAARSESLPGSLRFLHPTRQSAETAEGSAESVLELVGQLASSPASSDLQTRIETLWDGRDGLDTGDPEVIATVHEAINALGHRRGPGRPVERRWLGHRQPVVQVRRALLFKLSQMETIEHGPFEYADKIPLKSDYMERGVRAVPGAQARWGSYQAPGVVMMPSYTNIGAYVGEGTMVDTWATVGSCAQIGKNVHLSGGVGIGGVLELAQAAPVMIGDECMIGSRAIVAEGARVGEGTVLGAGAILTGSIPVIDVESGEEIGRGEVPSVVWPSLAPVPSHSPAANLGCQRFGSEAAHGRRTPRQVSPQRDLARSRSGGLR